MTSSYLRNSSEKVIKCFLLMISWQMVKALEGSEHAVVRDSGAELVGAGIVIEKGFQVGGRSDPFRRHPSGVTGYC